VDLELENFLVPHGHAALLPIKSNVTLGKTVLFRFSPVPWAKICKSKAY